MSENKQISKTFGSIVSDDIFNTFDIPEDRIKVTEIATKEGEKIAFLIGVQQHLEEKILHWYAKTKDEKFAEYFNIVKQIHGK